MGGMGGMRRYRHASYDRKRWHWEGRERIDWDNALGWDGKGLGRCKCHPCHVWDRGNIHERDTRAARPFARCRWQMADGRSEWPKGRSCWTHLPSHIGSEAVSP